MPMDAAAMGEQQRNLVINGEPASIDRYPYFTLVGDYCGGSLIAPDIVLTAGHCKTHHELQIRIAPSSRSEIKHIYESVLQVRHPSFDWRGDDDFSNDFLLIKLSEPSHHNIVHLSKKHVASTDIIAMGMGWTNRHRPSRAEHLQTVALRTIANDVCEASRARKMSYEGRIDDSMMCTTGGDHNERDTCNCDSGSPLILPGNQFTPDTIIGMVSWGMECADPDFPAVNSRISDSYEWIRGTTCGLSHYPPAYLCGEQQWATEKGIFGILMVGILAIYGWRRRCVAAACWNAGNRKQQYSLIAEASTTMNV